MLAVMCQHLLSQHTVELHAVNPGADIPEPKAGEGEHGSCLCCAGVVLGAGVVPGCAYCSCFCSEVLSVQEHLGDL